MSKLGVNKDYLKKKNRGLVLKLVATGQCSSRIELSKETGLTKTTISAIVGELIEKHYLVEIQKEATKDQGRNPVGLAVAEDSPRYAGVRIERGCAEAVLCDLTMKCFKYERVERKWNSGEEVMETVYSLLDRILEHEKNVAGIGVSSIGPVDIKEGIIKHPYFFNGIAEVKVTEPIRARYRLPVFFDHDNQSAVIAEQLFGNARGYQDILLIGIAEGVGCGMMLQGKRCHNNSGYSPEIGHLSINHHGNKCVCGNIGCLETYISSPVIEEKASEAAGYPVSYRQVCQRVEEPIFRTVMEEMIWNLSCGIISLQNIMNFEVILLGMDSIYWPDKYVQMLENVINEKKFANKETRTIVRKTMFLERTTVFGAVCNALNKTFEGEILL